jgi:hypothetical protein
MEKRNYKQLANQFKKLYTRTTDETAYKVKAEEESITLYPASTNYSNAFYHLENVVDFCRVYKLSCYVSTEDEKTVVKIF